MDRRASLLVDLSRGNRRLLFDFSNRGNRGAFTRLNDSGGADLSKESYAGNGFLNRFGYTAVWCHWQGDLVHNGSNAVAFRLEARQNGRPLRGKVRQEFIIDRCDFHFLCTALIPWTKAPGPKSAG